MSDPSDIEILLDALENFQDSECAMDLGTTLLNSDLSIEEKRDYFGEGFNLISEDKAEAMLNLWAVGVMLEDKLPIPQKVSAVRDFLQDPAVQIEWINEWIRQVYARNKAPKDMLEFIAIDLRNHSGIDDDLKKMLFEL